jgi:hypothetical protein
MTPGIDPAEVERALRVFIAPGAITELRVFGDRKWSGYFDRPGPAARALGDIGDCEGIYFIPSPINPALMARASNRLRFLRSGDPTTSDPDVIARRWLLIDVDPERPAKISSTDTEHEAALALACRIRDALHDRGWPEPVLADSGNGGHLCYRIDLPNNDEARDLCQRVLKGLDELFPDAIAVVDLTTFNAARIWKLPGTIAGKGDSIPDRPHRLARLLDVPQELAVVPMEKLEAIAARAPEADSAHTNGNRSSSGTDSITWLRDWIRDHNVPVEDLEPQKIAGGKLRWRLEACPWNGEHNRIGDAAIILRPDGKIGAQCFHAHCSGKGWRELRAIYEPGCYEGREERRGREAKPSVDIAEAPRWAPFPGAALAAPLRSLVREGARAIGCDEAFLALPALAMAAGAIGNARRLLLKRKWQEPAILWAGIVGESGTQKSPALSLSLEPLERWQDERIREWRSAMKEHEADLERYAKRLAEWKRCKGGDDPPEKPEEPRADRILVDKPTVEALAAILSTAPRGVLLYRDELAGWLGSFDQYHGGGRSDASHWLEAHRGGRWLIDRKTGTKIIHVQSAAVSVVGGIQPAILRRALEEGQHYEDGLAPRLLLTCPPRRARRWTEEDLSARTEESIRHLLERLMSLAMEGDEEAGLRPGILRLDAEARDLWISYYDRHGLEQVDLSGAIAATWSKLEAYAARLALIHRLVRWADGTDPIPPATVEAVDMEAAVTLADWFGAEARRVYALLGESPAGYRLRELAEWIASKGGAVTVRDATQGLRRYRGRTEDAEKDLVALVAAGRGAWETPPGHDGAGRPPAHVFRLSMGGYGFTNPETPAETRNSETVATPSTPADEGGDEAIRQAREYQARRPTPPQARTEPEEALPVWGEGREPGDEDEIPTLDPADVGLDTELPF